MDVVNDLHMGGSTSTEDVNLSQKRKMPKRKKQGNAVECEGPDFSLDNSSPKMDATINHPLHESPALPNFLSCQIIVEFNSTKQNEKSKRKKTTHNPIEGNNSGCGTSENTFSPKTSTPALDMLSGLPIQCFSTDPITSQSCEQVGFCQGDREEKEQKMIDTTAAKASSSALDMLSGHPIQCFSTDPITSQSCEEVGFCQEDHKEKEQKMINTTAAKASMPALDMLSGLPIRCFSTNPITSQSCEEVDFCQGDHEEKEQKMIDTTAAKASSPALDMLSGHRIQCFSTNPITSQSCEEVGFCQADDEKKEQKIISTTAAKASTPPALDMLSGHPIHCFSTDSITSQSCEEEGFCQGDHEEKEQKMINTTAARASTPALDMLSGHPIQYFSTDPITSQTCEEVDFFQVDYEEKEQKMINTTAAKASTPALDMLSGHPIQCFSTDLITSQSCEEVGFCQGDHEEKEQKMIGTTAAKASSPALDMLSGHRIQCFSTDPITSQSCEEVGFCQADDEKKEQKIISTTAAKASTPPALDMLSGHPIHCFSTDPITSQSCEEVGFGQGDHEEKEQKMINTTAARASTPALDMLSGHPIQYFSTDPITSQTCEQVGIFQVDYEEKEQKLINTTAAKASTPALDMLSGHPIQCFSTDPITSQSCKEVGFCQGDHEEKKQKMIKTTAEKQHNVLEVSGNPISVAASPEPFAKKCVPEVVKLNIEHSINDNISDLEDKNSFVDDTSLVKEDVDDPADYGLSDTNMCYKACARRQMVNADCRSSSGYPSPESPKKEPTFQDHDKDDSHKFSDGSLRVGLMGVETKLSIDQVTSHSGDAAEEIKLSTDIINEERFMTTSIVDIPVEHLEADGRQLDDTEITRSDMCCEGDQIELNTDNINEQISMTTSSAVDIHVEQLEKSGRQLDHAESTRNDLCCAGDVSDLSLDTVRDGHLKISQFSLDRSVSGNRKKKLLILDVNGLLADFVSVNVSRTTYRREPEPDFVLKGRKVYKRPFCEDFLHFCFDRFHVGVWSSRAKSNVDEAIKFLMGKSASKLLFCWNQSHCTTTEFTTVENIYKPLVLKELRKLWEKEEPDLPWEKGAFNESNTLLLDDSPYKALMNPMHSAIFPYSYRYYNTRDSELGPGGDLRIYLEGLAEAENVKNYVSENPFGQRPIREANPSWSYYRRVIESVQRSQQARPSSTG